MSDVLATETFGKGERGDGGRFARQASTFRDWVTADGSSGVSGRGGPLPPLRVAGLPVGAPHGHPARAQGPAGRDRHVDRRPDPRRARLGVHRRARHDRRRAERLGRSCRRPTSRPIPDFDGARHRAGAVGHADRAHRQQRVGRHHRDAELGVRRVRRAPRARPLPRRPARRRSTRSTRASTTTSTTASTGPASRRTPGGLRGGRAPAVRHARRARRAARDRRYLLGDAARR